MSGAYYNEIDQDAAAWLRINIDAGLCAPGFVDTRSIKEVQPDDLYGFDQHHFFAGIGGWSYAARLAGWPDAQPLWTASCPCQPFSVAGKQAGTDDARHLWPDLLRLWRAFRPACGVGEQVAGSAGYGWFDGVRADLEREGYAGRAVDIPACAIDAPHQRQRLYWVALAYTESGGSRAGLCEDAEIVNGTEPSDGHGVTLGDAIGPRLEGQRWDGDRGGEWPQSDRSASEADGGELAYPNITVVQGQSSTGQLRVDEQDARTHHGRNGSWWSGADWIICHDQKARRVADAGAPLLVDGFPNRILAWRGFGNAIVPPLAAEVIGALSDILATPKENDRAQG
jgi:DNA (cytosine-5)-methyltransferase 1